MKINIFEGGRRIRNVLVVIYIIAAAFITITKLSQGSQFDQETIEGLMIMALIVAAIYGLTFAIGFVVRGFKGIPMGQDTIQ